MLVVCPALLPQIVIDEHGRRRRRSPYPHPGLIQPQKHLKRPQRVTEYAALLFDVFDFIVVFMRSGKGREGKGQAGSEFRAAYHLGDCQFDRFSWPRLIQHVWVATLEQAGGTLRIMICAMRI